MKIGFVGLGIMGKPMAKNLFKAGYELVVYDIVPAPLEEVVKAGARAEASPAEVASKTDVIITMLPNSPHVKEAVLGKGGVIEGARKGIIVVDMSSIAPQVAQEVAAELANKGVEMLDAPVVILVFDVSGSMSATDMKPTRMEAAKAAASQFVGNQPAGVSIGVVAFSDGGLTVQSPTNDHNQTLDTIGRLVPRRGTSLANGILVGLNTIALDAGDPPILKTTGGNSATLEPIPAPQGWYPSAVIVLLSDGENNQDPEPMTAADLAADMGVRVYTVGLGSPGGSDITVEGGYTVHTQLNEPLLRSIAQDTGGNYYSASNGDELFKIYNDLKPKLTVKTEEMEVTSIFAGVGMLAFLIGGALSLLWFGRVP